MVLRTANPTVVDAYIKTPPPRVGALTSNTATMRMALKTKKGLVRKVLVVATTTRSEGEDITFAVQTLPFVKEGTVDVAGLNEMTTIAALIVVIKTAIAFTSATATSIVALQPNVRATSVVGVDVADVVAEVRKITAVIAPLGRETLLADIVVVAINADRGKVLVLPTKTDPSLPSIWSEALVGVDAKGNA